MVKVRKPEPPAEQQVDIEDVTQPSAEAVEAFASQADKTPAEIKASALDPDAPHNYKSINLPLNQYYFELLEKAAKKERRSKLDFLRMAIEKADKEGL